MRSSIAVWCGRVFPDHGAARQELAHAPGRPRGRSPADHRYALSVQPLRHRHVTETTCDPLEDAPGAAVIDDVRRTGATGQWTGTDPLITVAQAQLFALHKAAARGVDPMAPRHLSRAIIL